MDFLNEEKKLSITFDKDTVGDAYIAASEDTPPITISVNPNLSDLEAFDDKEYDEYDAWRNNNTLLSKYISSASECITIYDTFNNSEVSTGCIKSPINTESSTDINSDSNYAISNGTCKRYHNGKKYLYSFLMDQIKFLIPSVILQIEQKLIQLMIFCVL